MRCYRCKRHEKLVTMVKYSDGTARCPKCGKTIHYEPRKRRHHDSEGDTAASLVCYAIGMILFGFATTLIKLWQISLLLWAVAWVILAIVFFLKNKG